MKQKTIVTLVSHSICVSVLLITVVCIWAVVLIIKDAWNRDSKSPDGIKIYIAVVIDEVQAISKEYEACHRNKDYKIRTVK